MIVAGDVNPTGLNVTEELLTGNFHRMSNWTDVLISEI